MHPIGWHSWSHNQGWSIRTVAFHSYKNHLENKEKTNTKNKKQNKTAWKQINKIAFRAIGRIFGSEPKQSDPLYVYVSFKAISKWWWLDRRIENGNDRMDYHFKD